MKSRSEATITDLYQLPENAKAEIVNGEIVLLSPTGGIPGRAGGKIYRSLDDYEQQTGNGYAFPDNVGFTVNLPTRKSFSPDAAFHPGPLQGGHFLAGAPRFAAEVRSEYDYGPAAEEEIAAKRADYFAAGTLVVWDVDVLHDMVVRVYRADAPDNLPSTAVAILPRPSRPYPAGGYRLMLSCPDEHALQGTGSIP